ncbi:Tetratricopeptide repeat-containing protein [Algoriphagus faecimaris]|uniref:Tetratricopeptide repeat-containing protein n=1 Tax=Algoriphagus faecimaris TaxID=686796 RepID=A0A1G6RGN9_9BACT|nr:tetratricopeptide repeat protein [Algoriphagus faecimaris]SDD03086.1 Tetratricopeptide repeat-containing protein [Algoriphagus faecimaris]
MILRRFLYVFLSLSLLLTGHVEAQKKLSKKERKAQKNESLASRYFIEGTKHMNLGDLEKSFFYFQKSLEFQPEEAAIHYKIAEVFTKANQADKALPFAEKAVELDPENKYFSLMIAEIYSNLNQPLKAAEILDRLTADGESNQQYNLDLASIYLNAGEFDKALVVLDRAEEYYGVMEPITVQKQRIYLRKNQLDSAIAEGENLIEARPGNPSFVLSLVEILYNNNRADDALNLIQGEIEKYPNQPELQMAAHSLLKEKGAISESNAFLFSAFKNTELDPEVKARAFEGILTEIKTPERELILDSLAKYMVDFSSESATIYQALGKRAEMNGNQQKSITLYKQSLAIQPKNREILEKVILGSFGENADFEEVERFTVMGVDEFPENQEFWFYDGVVKSARQKDSLAVLSLKRALELNDGQNPQLDQVAFGSLGSSFYNLNEKDSAFFYFEKALKLNPNDEQVLNNYAYFLSLEKKDLEKAKSMSEKVVKRFPNNGTFLDTHAWVLFQMGDYEGAKKYMNLAIENESEPSGVMLEHYGDILYHLGQKSEAISFWKKAADSPEASEKLPMKIKDGKYHE